MLFRGESMEPQEINKGRKINPGEKTPRRRPVYPISAERELARAAVGYVTMAIKVCQSFVSDMMRLYEEPEEFRTDDIGDFITGVRGKRRAAADRLSEKTGALRKLEKEVGRSGNLAMKHSIDDWNDQVVDALGQEIVKSDYEDSMRQMVDSWIHQNVSQISSIPSDYMSKVEEIIRWGYETHQPKVNVYRRLEKLEGMTKAQARMIARDQLGTLNSQMTRHEHESMGISKYKWITRRDRKVRDCHRMLHGKVFSWSEPPAMWYSTKSRGIVYTGRYCHPGEDICCRCTASPVFDLEGAVMLLRRHFRGEEL